MKGEISISFQKYDNEHFIIFMRRNSVNLFMHFGLCGFENEMEYYDMPTKLVDFHGEKGFVFSNKIDKQELNEEIRRFAKHNNI